MPAINSRRSVLARCTPLRDTNAQLWLDRFIESQAGIDGHDDGSRRAKSSLIEQVALKLRTPSGYERWLQRTVTQLLRPGSGRIVRWGMFESVGRILVGSGDSGVLENGITLHHTWGVPFLPGPALKGSCASLANLYLDDDSWRKGDLGGAEIGDSFAQLFGTTRNAGKVNFLDGLRIASDGSDHGVYQDVITAHNFAYYQGNFDNDSKPDGTTDPIPVGMMSTAGSFLVMMEAAAEDEAWLNAAFEILTEAFQLIGVGAKSSAGYGFLKRADALPNSVRWLEEQFSNSRAAKPVPPPLGGGAMIEPLVPHNQVNMQDRADEATESARTSIIAALNGVTDDEYGPVLSSLYNTQARVYGELLLALIRGDTGCMEWLKARHEKGRLERRPWGRYLISNLEL